MTKSEEATKPLVIDGQELAKLRDELHSFIDQYKLDMHGDMKPDSKNIGLLGFVREVKRNQEDYPSWLYMFHKHPFTTTVVSLSVFLIFDTLSTFGLLRWLLNFFGIHLTAAQIVADIVQRFLVFLSIRL